MYKPKAHNGKWSKGPDLKKKSLQKQQQKKSKKDILFWIQSIPARTYKSV